MFPYVDIKGNVHYDHTPMNRGEEMQENLLIPKNNLEEQMNAPLMGTWRWSVQFCCPKCGYTRILDLHDISEDGIVTPTLKCIPPNGCDFEEDVILADYKL